MRPYIWVHLPGMPKNDIVDGLSSKAFSGNSSALRDLSKQPPRYDGANSAPFIHRRFGPNRYRYGSNPAMLADQIGDDPPVLGDAEVLYRNSRNLATAKAPAEEDCHDGAVRLPLTESESGTPRSSRAPAAVNHLPIRTPYSRRPQIGR